MIHSNERNLQRVLSQPGPLHVSTRSLTVPVNLEFRTEHRARSRSTSVHSSRVSGPELCTMMDHMGARERLAAEKHLERMTAASVLARAKAVLEPRAADSRTAPPPPSGATCSATETQERWIREATTAEERAQRARTVARALRSEVEKTQRARLCIFAHSDDLEADDASDDSPTGAQATEAPLKVEW